jgi:hypothetical protein
LQQTRRIHDEGSEQRTGMIAISKPKTRHSTNIGLGNWFASTRLTTTNDLDGEGPIRDVAGRSGTPF